MYISDGNSTKKFTLYPPARKITELDDTQWIEDEEDIQPLFTISEISEDIQILNTLENFESSSEYKHEQFQEESNNEFLYQDRCLFTPWINLAALQSRYF